MTGPVFRLEMITQGRARRTYALRVLVGLGLLLYVGASYHDAFPGSAETVRAGDVAAFARRLFQGLAVAQGLAAVVLAPALAAGAVAGEAQRKTLDELLTTELTAVEVVADKAAARLTQVAGLLLASLPVLLVTAELGGYGPAAAFGALGVAGCTAFTLAGLALVASTVTRSIRAAMNATMTIGLAWLIIPGAIEVLLPRAGAIGFALFPWVAPINAWSAASSPFAVWLRLVSGRIATTDQLAQTVAWMIGLQLVGGVALIALAAALLRPGARLGKAGLRRRRRAEPERGEIPPCGDDPMFWKEVVVPRIPAFYRPVALLTVLALGAMLMASTVGYAWAAFQESLALGYGVSVPGSARANFLLYLRIVATGVALVYLLGVASDAAASLTWEREKDTWISLIATPLTGAEIVRGKVLGAFWGIRHTAAAFGGLVLLGIVAGSVHPLAVPLLAAEFAAMTALAGTLGVFVSLRSGSTTRALSTTMLLLVALNASGLLLGLIPGLPKPIAMAGCAPLGVAASLASPGDLAGVPSFGNLATMSDAPLSGAWVSSRATVLAACAIGVGLHLLAAFALYRTTCRGFDAALDRPTVAPPDALAEARPATQTPRAALPGRPAGPMISDPRSRPQPSPSRQA